MCGIVGLVRPHKSGNDAEIVQRMATLLFRRGPDGEGYYFGDQAAMGMRRLAIIDVEGGNQPIHNEDRSVWVVFNGEIYNYGELREDLSRRCHRFYTQSDTECLVHLYEDFGDECVSYLRGMFAFAIWDQRRNRLMLGRDRLGIKPLYYWHTGDKLVFASEMKCFLILEDFERRVNLEALSAFFTFKYVPGPLTIYDRVYEVPPAHIGVWTGGDFTLKRYWSIKPDPDYSMPVEFFAEGIAHHLGESVKLHRISDVPLGAFLSGGIDSSSIVAMMAQTSTERVKTFTVGFTTDDSSYDERSFARLVAEVAGTEHSETLLTAQVHEILPEVIRAFDEPFADSSAIPNFLVFGAARQWVTVALSGLGGDELFAGYERYRGTLLADYYRRLPIWLRHGLIDSLIRLMPEGRNGALWRDRLKRFTRGADLALADRYQHYISAYNDAEKRELFSSHLLYELGKRGLDFTPLALGKPHDEFDPLDSMLFADIQTYLPDDELRKTDRLSMWHSLEVRVPFLDHKFVEFVATIPAAYKLRRWQKKHILIRALEGILPQTILRRRKQGFSIPLNSWLRGPLRDFVRTYLAESALRKVGLFDPKSVARVLKEHDEGFRNHESKIWVLLTFMLWHELYMENYPW